MPGNYFRLRFSLGLILAPSNRLGIRVGQLLGTGVFVPRLAQPHPDALAGCAHHTPKPEGSTLAATNALLRLAEANQATAKAAAAKLAPGQFVFIKTNPAKL